MKRREQSEETGGGAQGSDERWTGAEAGRRTDDDETEELDVDPEKWNKFLAKHNIKDDDEGDGLSREEANGGESGDSAVGAGRGEDESTPSPDRAEGREPKRAHAPPQVSERMRDDHNATHTPFRAWCRHCVRGRARNAMHKKKGSGEDKPEIPRISMDYFYMTEANRKAHQDPILIMTDELTKEKYARAVGQKGLGADGNMDWLIKDLSAELRVWGHAGGEGGSVIIKSDSENAIVAVRNALAKYHGGRVVPEAPAKGESKSNGTVEDSGKTVREYSRVLRSQVEEKADMKLEER